MQHVKSSGRSVGITTIADVVNRFIDHINRFAPGTIPPDPRGRVTPIRFRRTLAWHIANQPGGLVALAVQYGHLRTAISEGYASRVRDGIQDLVDFETARSIAYRLSDAAESFDNGVGVSGPSALRFVEALREQTAQFGGIVASQRQARSLLNNTKLTVFQNADAFLWCNFKNDTALCLIDRDDADRATTPRLDRCKANCSNVARTDSDASALRLTAASFRQQATHMPRPAADRLNARADDLVDQADMHDRDRFTIEQIDANF
ncbi:hypothetical protein [Curtobacterium sp. 24E2]|nr:hypothetical protein JN350_10805 [Curtobacterium sp. 24E2]